MSIYNLKPAFQNLLRPIVGKLVFIGITANFITLLATISSIAVGILIYFNIKSAGYFLILPAFLFFRMALNAIDGMIAREHNMKSNLGIYLNEIGDVVSDTALYLPFCFIQGISFIAIIFIVIASIISEMVGVISIQIDGKRHYEGPMGKSDRAFIFGLIAIIYAIFNSKPEAILAINSIIIISALLVVVTIFNRIKSSLSNNA